MRIRQLSLVRYGKFTGRLLEFPKAERDIHLIVGPNEAGKSTSRSAVIDLLFGIPTRTPLAFLHPMPELRLGGVLEHEGANFEFQRSKGNGKTLRTPADAVLPDDALQAWIGDSNRALFEQMHGLDHAALVKGGDGILSAADDLGRLLFQSAAGMDQLGRVLAALEEEEGALWAPRKSKQREYYLALEAFEDAGRRLKESTARTRDWKDQQDAVRDAEQALQAVLAQQRAVRSRRSQLERIRRVLPALRALDQARAQMSELGEVPLLPADAGAVMNQCVTEAALAETEHQRHGRDQQAAQAALAALRLAPGLLARVPDIRALGEDRLQFRGHRDEIARRTQELQGHWGKVQAAIAELGWDAQTDEQRLRARLPAPALRSSLERLIQQQGGLVQQRDASRRSLQAKQAELEQARAALEALPPASGEPALQAALERARRLGDHEQVLLDLQAQRQRAEAALCKALAQLGAWTAEPQALRAMLPPDAALLQQLLSGQRRDGEALLASEAQIKARGDEAARARQELDHLIAAWQPVSREQVLAARQARDESWREIREEAALLPAAAPAFEQAIQHADALADARLDKIQHEAERQARAHRIELLGLEIAQERARAEALRQQIAQAQRQWLELSQACGLPGLPLELASDWIAARQQALASADALDEALRQQALKQAQGEEARLALLRELQADASTGLAHAIKLAEARVDRASRAQGQRATLAEQVADAGRALTALQAADEQAERQWTLWLEAWSANAARAGFAVDQDMAQVRSELAAMAGIGLTLDKMQALRVERIEVMRADLDALAGRTRELAQGLAPELLDAGRPTEDIVIELMARADAAVQAEAEATRLRRQLEMGRSGSVAAEQRLQGVKARLAPLVAASGHEDREELARAIERSERRRQMEAEQDAALRRLRTEGDGLDLEALRAEVETVDAGELAARLAELAQQEDQLLEQARTLGASHEKARARLAEFDGSDKAALADADRQDAIARMAQSVESYVKARTASRLLKWAIDQHRQTRQGPMLTLASGIFSELTLGSFGRLIVDGSDSSKPRLQGLRPDGRTTVDIEGMSEGSRDQLYLALRLAALHMQAGSASQQRALPFIADDLFINFDDRRSGAGLRALGELSRKTQVLFLTHHEHLVEVAREALGPSLNVVHL